MVISQCHLDGPLMGPLEPTGPMMGPLKPMGPLKFMGPGIIVFPCPPLVGPELTLEEWPPREMALTEILDH